MSFNLSAIEKFGAGAGGSKPPPSRSSKFAPRARARPTQKPAEKQQPAQPAEDAEPSAATANGQPQNNAPPQQPAEQGDVPAAGLPRAAAPQRPECAAAQASPAAVPPPAAEAAPAAPPRPADTAAEAAPAQASQPSSSPAGAAPSPGMQAGSQHDAALEAGSSALVLAAPPAAQAGAGAGQQLTVVAPDSGAGKEVTPKGRARGATGREGPSQKERRMTTEEQATMSLSPGTHSIGMYVKRALAQERLRTAEKKRKRAEEEQQGAPAGEGGKRGRRGAPAQPAAQAGGSAPVLEMALVDGRLVPSQASMVVPAARGQAVANVVEYDGHVTNRSHADRAPSERWTPEQTEAFFRAVQCFGPNFELISKLFPGRPRRALANKWRRESKLNPDRIAAAYEGGGGAAGLRSVVDALSNVEADEEGVKSEIGLEATQLFETEAPPQPEEEAGEPQPRKKAARGRGRAKRRARSPSLSDSEPEAEAEPEPRVSFRKAGSRRKAQPAQSLPAEQAPLPAQGASKGKKGKGARGKAVAGEAGEAGAAAPAATRRSARPTRGKVPAEQLVDSE